MIVAWDCVAGSGKSGYAGIARDSVGSCFDESSWVLVLQTCTQATMF